MRTLSFCILFLVAPNMWAATFEVGDAPPIPVELTWAENGTLVEAYIGGVSITSFVAIGAIYAYDGIYWRLVDTADEKRLEVGPATSYVGATRWRIMTAVQNSGGPDYIWFENMTGAAVRRYVIVKNRRTTSEVLYRIPLEDPDAGSDDDPDVDVDLSGVLTMVTRLETVGKRIEKLLHMGVIGVWLSCGVLLYIAYRR